MAINFKKSSCIRIGPRNDATCASIVSLNDHVRLYLDSVFMFALLCFCVATEFSVNKDLHSLDD